MYSLLSFPELNFNVHHGYLDGLVRGFKGGILTRSDYLNLVQCETLEDVKLHLQSTDYGNFLANEPGPLKVQIIQEKMQQKLVEEFRHLRNHATGELAQFLDFITYSYMIDNIVFLINGTNRELELNELIPKCHPLGQFEQLEAISVAQTPTDLYNAVLIDTPLASYFKSSLSSEQDLSEMDVEIIRNTLYKEYLEDFYDFCVNIGGTTAEFMTRALGFEADRRCFVMTINSFDTELSKEDRASLFPDCGSLGPIGLSGLGKAEDYDQVRQVADNFMDHKMIFDGVGTNVGEKTLEDKFFEKEVEVMLDAYMQQFHYGVFYAYVKLKEQEIRNIVWISECIAQRHKAKIDCYIPILP